MNTTELKETHWHAADVSGWQRITESVPAIIETELKSEYRQDFDEGSCGGVYDGFGIVSDADPRL